MIKEIQYSQDSEQEIYDVLLSFKDKDHVLVIRNAKNDERDRNYWIEFLSKKCHFTLDQRHYDSDSNPQKNKWWEISNQPDKENAYAYSTTPQPLHTDNAWFRDAAEINFFIMEKQAVQGGEQIIYPISRLLNDLEKIDSTLLDDLLNTEVTISKGEDEDKNVTPIITLSEGAKIHWNYYRTIKTNNFINELCERFFSFLQVQQKSNSVSHLRCETGDSFSFNDKKLLHGRTAFKAKAPRERVLIQSMWRYS